MITSVLMGHEASCKVYTCCCVRVRSIEARCTCLQAIRVGPGIGTWPGFCRKGGYRRRDGCADRPGLPMLPDDAVPGLCRPRAGGCRSILQGKGSGCRATALTDLNRRPLCVTVTDLLSRGGCPFLPWPVKRCSAPEDSDTKRNRRRLPDSSSGLRSS